MLSRAPNEIPAGSLLREGAAMINALATDFSKLEGTEVVAFRDRRLNDFELPCGVSVVDVGSADEETGYLRANARAADWTIVIAPEFDNLLLERVRQVERAGGRLLSPTSTVIAGVQDKHTTLRQLADCGLATPRGVCFRGGSPLPRGLRYPAILKPLDGAGSLGVTWLASADARIQLPAGQCFRLEEFCPGTAASVSVLCGPNGPVTLPPSRQHLSDDRTFRYLGGQVPLAKPLRGRAERLAIAAARAAMLDVGYVGIDMVLADHSAERDVVIEINPRLTTSYVGLRQLARGNLASAMIEVAEGKTPDLSFGREPVEFSADGTILSADLGKEQTQ